jgi:hypothetical protein
MTWGSPGIGKSDTYKQAAKEIAKKMNLPFKEGKDPSCFGYVDIRLSQLDPSDLRGLPNIVGNKTTWLTPDFFPTSGQGFIIFEEINLAPPSIQGAAYQLILDRKLGDYIIPDGWSVFAVGNKMTDGAMTFEMPKPLQNRFAHAGLMAPSVEDWVAKWAMQAGIDSRIMSFLKSHPDHLMIFKADSDDVAFATPRSWHMLSDYIKDVEDVDWLEKYASSTVGTGVGIEFATFIKHQLKVDFKALLKNPKEILKYTSMDMKYSIMGGLFELYKKDKKLLDNMFEISIEVDPEFGAFLCNMIRISDENDFRKKAPSCASWKSFVKKYAKYIRSDIE